MEPNAAQCSGLCLTRCGPAAPQRKRQQAAIAFLLQGQFADINLTTQAAGVLLEQIVTQDGGGIDGVDRQQDELGLRGEEFTAGPEEWGEVTFDFPELAGGSAAEGGRSRSTSATR